FLLEQFSRAGVYHDELYDAAVAPDHPEDPSKLAERIATASRNPSQGDRADSEAGDPIQEPGIDAEGKGTLGFWDLKTAPTRSTLTESSHHDACVALGFDPARSGSHFIGDSDGKRARGAQHYLLPHQVVGLSFMKKQEEGPIKFGILYFD